MPRAIKLDTETMKRLLVSVAKNVKDGELKPSQGNCMISAYRAVIYGNQVIAQEERNKLEQALLEHMERLEECQNGGATSVSELPPQEVKFSNLEE